MDRRFYSNDTTTSDLASIPTTQASGITWVSWSSNSIKIKFTKGDGDRRLVLCKQGTTLTEEPSDGQQYSAPYDEYGYNFFGQGSKVGDAYAVYDGISEGAAGDIAVTSFSANTAYCFRVFEYNGSGETTRYLKTTATNNPKSRKTSL